MSYCLGMKELLLLHVCMCTLLRKGDTHSLIPLRLGFSRLLVCFLARRNQQEVFQHSSTADDDGESDGGVKRANENEVSFSVEVLAFFSF